MESSTSDLLSAFRRVRQAIFALATLRLPMIIIFFGFYVMVNECFEAFREETLTLRKHLRCQGMKDTVFSSETLLLRSIEFVPHSLILHHSSSSLTRTKTFDTPPVNKDFQGLPSLAEYTTITAITAIKDYQAFTNPARITQKDLHPHTTTSSPSKHPSSSSFQSTPILHQHTHPSSITNNAFHHP